MTRQEHAIEDLKEFQKLYPNNEVFQYCLDMLDKYTWHDLRKNPGDLPKENKPLLILYVDVYGGGKYVYKDYIVSTFLPLGGIARAWRYIESFEED